MKKITSILFLGASLALFSVAFAAEEKAKTETAAASSEHVMYAAADLKWGDAPPSLPAGAKLAVLEGDPKKEGLFTIRLQMPAGFKIPPHTHPTAEHVTVISGTCYLGMGPKFDEATAKTMTAGAYAVMPAGMQHFAGSKEGCVIQVHATGPFEVKYVNPADDPRTAKK
ncbi:MAG TPA: cupin domain-containing protein [Chthoniobacterales bacterium]|nr:cupin domain-containing protein [Chthoniobacterales bacterium]